VCLLWLLRSPFVRYVPGGDLRGLLKNIGCLEESMAKFYLIEMLACVEALHKLGFVHRDL
jgi:cell cycle protein kinase DBF2